jgi:C-terminal processing protease CtpA/Prc
MYPYNGKIIVLVSEATLSVAETTSAMFRTAINATLIGRPAAGANGSISRYAVYSEWQGRNTGTGNILYL